MVTAPGTQGHDVGRRPPQSLRRAGYLVAAGINLLLIWLVNVTPGWRWVPFLTEDFAQVVWLVNVSLLVGVVVNLAYLDVDPPWAKRLGDAVTAAIGCVIFVRLWVLFPFDVADGWSTPLRIGVAIGVVGTAIGALGSLAAFVGHLVGGSEDAPAS